jgi:predicted nucleic acid-binding protein
VLRQSATIVDDPAPQLVARSSRDPGDDYLLALAADQQAALVSGDNDLLALAAELPIHSPATFASLIERY